MKTNWDNLLITNLSEPLLKIYLLMINRSKMLKLKQWNSPKTFNKIRDWSQTIIIVRLSHQFKIQINQDIIQRTFSMKRNSRRLSISVKAMERRKKKRKISYSFVKKFKRFQMNRCNNLLFLCMNKKLGLILLSLFHF